MIPAGEERARLLQPEWGPNVGDVFPDPANIDGVIFCSGHDLVDVVTANDDRLTPDDVDDLYQRLDDYVTSRTAREIDDQGPVPRPLTDYGFDVAFGALVGMVSMVAVGNATRMQPAIITYPAVCVAIIVVAATALARTDGHRVRASAIGAIAASSGMLLIAVVIVVANAVTSFA